MALLRAWMPGQRWFAGKDQPITGVLVGALWPLASAQPAPLVVHLVIEVMLGDDARQIYQVPVAIYPPNSPAAAAAVEIGRLSDGSLVVDALTDVRVLTSTSLELSVPAVLDPDVTHSAPHGGPHPPQLQAPTPASAWGSVSARPMSVEQSNTSVILDDEVLLKVFRQLVPGINPDIEVHAALGRAGSTHIGRCRAWVNGSWYESDGSREVAGQGDLRTGHLAMVQELLRPAVDGWELACARAADGVSFEAEAHALGIATAEVHRDLRTALPTRTVEGAELAALVDRLTARLSGVVATVPELAPIGDQLRVRIESLGDLPGGLRLQRVHGDYHLGQVLLVGDSWKLLDFEGEPGAPIAERAALDHPLRDVAGMLRSFAYAAAQGGADRPEQERAQWQAACEHAFRSGYHEGTGGSDSQTGEASEDTILAAYLVDKAAYEASYEKRNRPDWLPIPLAALTELAG